VERFVQRADSLLMDSWLFSSCGLQAAASDGGNAPAMRPPVVWCGPHGAAVNHAPGNPVRVKVENRDGASCSRGLNCKSEGSKPTIEPADLSGLTYSVLSKP